MPKNKYHWKNKLEELKVLLDGGTASDATKALGFESEKAERCLMSWLRNNYGGLKKFREKFNLSAVSHAAYDWKSIEPKLIKYLDNQSIEGAVSSLRLPSNLTTSLAGWLHYNYGGVNNFRKVHKLKNPTFWSPKSSQSTKPTTKKDTPVAKKDTSTTSSTDESLINKTNINVSKFIDSGCGGLFNDQDDVVEVSSVLLSVFFEKIISLYELYSPNKENGICRMYFNKQWDLYIVFEKEKNDDLIDMIEQMPIISFVKRSCL